MSFERTKKLFLFSLVFIFISSVLFSPFQGFDKENFKQFKQTIFTPNTAFALVDQTPGDDPFKLTEEDKAEIIAREEAKVGFWEGIGDAILAPFLGNAIRIVSTIMVVVGAFLEIFLGMIVALSMILFEFTLNLSVYNFHNFVEGGNLKEIWKTFRDLGNIGLIFVLLYIAIKTILQTSGFDTKKLLGSVIIAALLINFSFFFAGVVIDVANNMAVELYTSATQKAQQSEPKSSNIGLFFFDNLNTGKILATLTSSPKSNPSTLSFIDDAFLSRNSSGKASWDGFNSLKIVAGVYLSLIFGLVVAAVFAIAAILILTRLIILMLLLVTSPIAFVSFILPQTSSMAKQWWDALISQSFFLPIFLLFIVVAMKVTEGVKKISTSTSNLQVNTSGGFFGVADIASGTAKKVSESFIEFAPTLFQYLIVLGLFIAALTASKTLSGRGGKVVSQISGKITTSIGKGVFGSAGFVGRNTIGAGASALRDSKTFQSLARRTGVVGSLGLKGLDGVAKSSFDARGAKSFQGVATATGFGKGDFGSVGGKDGFEGQSKNISKTLQDVGKLYKDKELTKDDKNEALLNSESVQDANKKLVDLQNNNASEKEIDAAKRELDKEKDNAVKLAKEAPQREYAQRLKGERGLFTNKEKEPKKKWGDLGTGGKFARGIKNVTIAPITYWNRKPGGDAGSKIIKELTKDKTDKRFDDIEELLKKTQAKKDDE